MSRKCSKCCQAYLHTQETGNPEQHFADKEIAINGGTRSLLTGQRTTHSTGKNGCDVRLHLEQTNSDLPT